MKNYKYSISFAALIFALATAHADTPAKPSVTSLIGALQIEQPKEPQLKAEMDGQLAANEALDKERRIYLDQIQTRLQPIEAAIKADVARLAVDIAKYNQGVGRHNVQCAGQKSKADFDRCNGEKAYWDRAMQRLEGEKGAIGKRAVDYDKQAKVYAARMDQIEAQMKKNFAAWQAAQKALEETHARIANLRAQLVDACKTARTDEELKYCNDLKWSGAKKGLPKLEDVRPNR